MKTERILLAEFPRKYVLELVKPARDVQPQIANPDDRRGAEDMRSDRQQQSDGHSDAG
jgi:hypothetical protein